MMIWLLALILVASVAALGYRQGVIRVAFSFLGIIAGALLAVPLAGLVAKVLGMFGLKDPLMLWALAPVVAFIVISAAFKIGALPVHQKVDVYYKYHSGDLRLALWERLSRRLGLCLGVLNGVLYAVLLAFLIYVPSYATVQFESSDQDPKWLRWLSSLGRGLQSTGLDNVARSIDRTPDLNYRMVDMAALLYRNPLAEARVGSYPAFLMLAELPEFTEMSTDKGLLDPWHRQIPIMQLLETPRLVNIRNNPELLKTVWNTTAPDLEDFRAYLKTGRSARYDPIKVLGRWKFDVSAAVGAIRRTRPAMSSRDMQNLRRFMDAAFGKTGLIARPDHSVSLKNSPGLRLQTAAAAAASPDLQTFQGQWKDLDGKYALTFSGTEMPATVEGDRLTLKSDSLGMVFNRED
ncbi:MAG TPA: CvpA family protein [Verrucomicrobiae bacterium]